jgi:hypothetical protein
LGGTMKSPTLPVAPLLYTVDQFCALANISRAHYYRLRAAGKGPALLKTGDRSLISADAARTWVKQLEDEASSTQLRPRGRFGRRPPTLADMLMGRA